MCRLDCSLCWALDNDLVCPMLRQLTPSHAQQIYSVWHTVGLHTDYTWHSTLDASFQIALQRLEGHMLIKSVCVYSDRLVYLHMFMIAYI